MPGVSMPLTQNIIHEITGKISEMPLRFYWYSSGLERSCRGKKDTHTKKEKKKKSCQDIGILVCKREEGKKMLDNKAE